MLLKLHSHDVLHLHEVVWDHSKLLVLWVISTTLWIEHHLHVHIWINIIHSLAWESHLILHHHTLELVHVLHAIHSDWRWHLVVHPIILSHLWTAWCAIIGSQLVIAVCVRAFISIFAMTACISKQIKLKFSNLALQTFEQKPKKIAKFKNLMYLRFSKCLHLTVL